MEKIITDNSAAAKDNTMGSALKQPRKTAQKKPRKKKRLLIIILSIAVLVLTLAFLLSRCTENQGMAIAYNDTTLLAYGDFTNAISATGTVESANSTFIYSTLSYAVQDVYVEVGDYVEQGQTLAKLDDKNIRNQTESQAASISSSDASNAQAIKTAQDNYDNYKYSLENGLNSSINNAYSQMNNAYQGYTKAITAYQRYKAALGEGENTTLLNQEAALNNARAALESAEDAYDKAEAAAIDAHSDWQATQAKLAELNAQKEAALAADPQADITTLEGKITDAAAELKTRQSAYHAANSQADTAKHSRENAKDSYHLARAQYNAAVSSVDDALADYADAVDSAYQTYQEALTNLEATQLAADNQLNTYANSLQSARANANNAVSQVSMRQLQVDLASTNITAPVAGTVTAVYAKIGNSGAGLLFVIEDIDSLIIETSVKEYDVSVVEMGMPVTIRSDATGSDVYEGRVDFIAPTSHKTAQGATDISGDVEFAAEVKVISADTKLRIGMSVRLNYIIDQQTEVLTVPYDAVYTNHAGEKCVLVLEEQTDGKYLIQEYAVNAGLENDLDIVISGSEIGEGLRVINEPEEYLNMLGKETLLIDSRPTNMTPFSMG